MVETGFLPLNYARATAFFASIYYEMATMFYCTAHEVLNLLQNTQRDRRIKGWGSRTAIVKSCTLGLMSLQHAGEQGYSGIWRFFLGEYDTTSYAYDSVSLTNSRGSAR